LAARTAAAAAKRGGRDGWKWKWEGRREGRRFTSIAVAFSRKLECPAFNTKQWEGGREGGRAASSLLPCPRPRIQLFQPLVIRFPPPALLLLPLLPLLLLLSSDLSVFPCRERRHLHDDSDPGEPRREGGREGGGIVNDDVDTDAYAYSCGGGREGRWDIGRDKPDESSIVFSDPERD